MKLVKESLNQSFTRGNDDKLNTIGVGKIVSIKKWLDDNHDILKSGAHVNNNGDLVITNFNIIDKEGLQKIGIPSYINVIFKSQTIQLKMGISMNREDWVNKALDNLKQITVPPKFEMLSLKLEDQDFRNITSEQQYKDGNIFFYDPLLNQIFSVGSEYQIAIYSKSGFSGAGIYSSGVYNYNDLADIIINFRDKKLKKIMKENKKKSL